jgi:hypothetical protein
MRAELPRNEYSAQTTKIMVFFQSAHLESNDIRSLYDSKAAGVVHELPEGDHWDPGMAQGTAPARSPCHRPLRRLASGIDVSMEVSAPLRTGGLEVDSSGNRLFLGMAGEQNVRPPSRVRSGTVQDAPVMQLRATGSRLLGLLGIHGKQNPREGKGTTITCAAARAARRNGEIISSHLRPDARFGPKYISRCPKFLPSIHGAGLRKRLSLHRSCVTVACSPAPFGPQIFPRDPGRKSPNCRSRTVNRTWVDDTCTAGITYELRRTEAHTAGHRPANGKSGELGKPGAAIKAGCMVSCECRLNSALFLLTDGL